MASPLTIGLTPTSRFSPAPNLFAGVGWPVALTGQLLLVFALVALSSPGRIDIVDGQTRYEVARSLVDHGDSVIRDSGAWFAVYNGRNGDKYTDYRMPQSVLGAAAIVIADATGPVEETRRQFFFSLISPFMAALLAVIYAICFRNLGHGTGASLAWGVAGVFCTPSWYYGTSTFDDILGTTAVVFAAAVALWARGHRPLLGAVLAGLAMAWAVNCKPPLIVFTLPVLAALCAFDRNWRRQLLPASMVGLGVFFGVFVYKAYHAYKFPPGTDNPFAEYEKLYGNWTTSNPLPGLASLAFSTGCGALWYCPTLLLSWRGWTEWREQESLRWFCRSVLIASLLFVLSVCFLPFFKGEPCWGPRYLTPMFALWWLFAPAALARVRMRMANILLAFGLAVQLLGLSVDPMRLFVQLPLHWGYFNTHPWLGFDATISHLVQRPREIVEILTYDGPPAPEFNPAALPTHAGCVSSAPPGVVSIVGVMGTPYSAGPLNGAIAFWPAVNLHRPIVTQQSLHRFHIFNSLRPWVLSQQYLAENDRPVELAQTVQLLANCSLGGLILIWFGCRLQARLSTKMRSLYFLSHRLNGHQAAPTYLTQSFAPASNVT